MINYTKIRNSIVTSKPRSAWGKGVKEYAIELLENWSESGYDYLDELTLLNGAANWHEYSWGGSSLIYDADIAARLCTMTEWKRTAEGTRKPNKREEWLDVQARALFQAARLIMKTVREA